MLIPVLLFLVGLACLIKGGDWFVDGAVGIAHRFHMPELLIGATVVSIGTTLPEVMVSAQAALEHNSGISYGNAIGSVICNTSLIAALTIAIRPSGVDKKTLRFPVAAFFLSAGIYAGIAYTTGRFQRVHGLLFLAMFLAYIILNVIQMKRSPVPDPVTEETSETEKPIWADIGLLALGAVLIAVGAKLLVDNGTLIAEAQGVASSVIGLTMVALGTSLPELVTAITALAKGHSALSLGNIIGANIFNLILVSGTAITISPFAIPVEKTIAGMNASLVVDIPVMLSVMAILTLPPLATGKLKRWQGILLLCIYVGFTAFQFIH